MINRRLARLRRASGVPVVAYVNTTAEVKAEARYAARRLMQFG